MMNWELIEEVNNQPRFRTTVVGAEVTVGFLEEPNPNLKNALIDILTSCYEERINSI